MSKDIKRVARHHTKLFMLTVVLPTLIELVDAPFLDYVFTVY